jgi:predicted O-linked N-acetylglucosamine transferase (SPINDLY family)
MDYRFTDAVADPVGDADRFATEQLVRFSPVAWSYAPPVNTPEPGPLPALANGRVNFGCFNNMAKLTDPMLKLWARVLAAVPNSRLLLKGRGFGDPAARAAFLARLQRQGIAPEQVVLFERSLTTADHLAVYGQVDIAFDSFPYNGTTTTCEALWMGVPVIALCGDRHVSRVSASLLTAAGHPDWIARDSDDFVRIAAALAADLQRLEATRIRLRGDMQHSMMLDHAGQAAFFSAALRECWRAWCVSQSPPKLAPLAMPASVQGAA